MNDFKTTYSYFKILCFLAFLFLFNGAAIGQTTKEEAMDKLSFMIGDWVGISAVYENGEISKQVPAFQKISYDLNKSIVVIELHSESLLLHTIIYYDEKDQTYYYNPFSKNGVRKLPAAYKDGQFIVSSSETNRFVFGRPSEHTFREYGEKLVDGKWEKYFEDNFKNTH